MGITVTGDRADPLIVVGNRDRPIGVGDTIAPTRGNSTALRGPAVCEIRTWRSGRARLRGFQTVNAGLRSRSRPRGLRGHVMGFRRPRREFRPFTVG